MSRNEWQGSGAEYRICWAGPEWILTLDGERPGLRRPGLPGSVLCLEGVAASGRSEPDALSGKTVSGVELFRSRVEATYSPRDWGGLGVRAAWSPSEDGNGIDLEVQVSATSVDELRSVEVFVASRFLDAGETASVPVSSWVHPRDARSAALSYDGREAPEELARLTTLPVPSADQPAFPPVSLASPWSDLHGQSVVEMIHPQDVSRRILLCKVGLEPTPGPAIGVRHALFGHDLEKGVVVRARMRAIWVRGTEDARLSATAFRRFLDMPPPLGM